MPIRIKIHANVAYVTLLILNLTGHFNPLQDANCCRNFRHVVD